MPGKKNRTIFLVFIIVILLLSAFFLFGRMYLFNREYNNLPNVLLISLDSLRADHLSCYGYSRLTSPFIDSLADRGVRFDKAFTNTHSTIPSHLTMLTSLYTETHQVSFNIPGNNFFSFSIPENIVMLQQVLKEYGYITLGISEGKTFEEIGFSKGFDEFFSVKKQR